MLHFVRGTLRLPPGLPSRFFRHIREVLWIFRLVSRSAMLILQSKDPTILWRELFCLKVCGFTTRGIGER